MARFTLLVALFAAVTAFQAPMPAVQSRLAASRVAPSRVAMVEEPSDKAITIGAAAVGGIVGVYFFHEISAGLLLAISLAYGSTLTNKFGEISKTSGGAAAKAYSKALELNEQYELIPKAKTALDTTTTAVGNLNENYGITSTIDEKLKIGQAVDKVTSKVDELKTSVNDKLDDLKSKAASS